MGNSRTTAGLEKHSLKPPGVLLAPPLPQALSSDLTSLEAAGDENSLFGRSVGRGGAEHVLQLQPGLRAASAGPTPCTHLSRPRTLELLQAQLTSVPPWPSSVLLWLQLLEALPFLPAWPTLQNQEDLAFRDHQGQTAICPGKGSDLSGHPSKLKAEP